MTAIAEHQSMTTGETADYLNISPATLETWRCRGGGPPFRKLGRAVRYLKTDVDEWLAEQLHESTVR